MSHSTLINTSSTHLTRHHQVGNNSISNSIQSLLHPHSHSPSTTILPRPSLIQPSSEPPDRLLDTRNGQMPASFANLLTLHGALENALLLHLSTQGANVAVTLNSFHPSSSALHPTPTTPSRPVDQRMKTPEPEDYHPQTPDASDHPCSIKTFRFENLISWPVIKPIVERASGSVFSEYHLAQLLWLWQNDPEDIREAPESSGSSHDILGTPHLDSKSSSKQQAGMGFIISTVRVLEGSIASPTKKRITYTYGLGLEVKARENPQLPTYSLESPGKSNQFLQSSPTRINQNTCKSPSHSPKKVVKPREIMNLVALWSSKTVERKNEIARRLRSYWSIHSDLPSTPGSPSRIDEKHQTQKIIKIPLGNLPNLDSNSNVKSNSKRKISSTVLLSPNLSFYSSDDDDLEFDPCCTKRLKSHLDSPLPSKILPPVNLSNLSPLQIKKPQSNSSVPLRALHLFERIKAKEQKLSSSNLDKDLHQDQDP